MSEITDWEPEQPQKLKHSFEFEYGVPEYRQFIKEMELDLKKKDAEIKRLATINELDRKKLIERFSRLQRIAIIGLEAVFLVLGSICEANTFHWQKKENLRNAMGILQALQKRIGKALPEPLPFDDNF